jgi:hypothetical protein
MIPSAEPGKRLALGAEINRGSAHQSDVKGSSLALCVMKATLTL